jgi:sugar phosphate isomerase/epimerase
MPSRRQFLAASVTAALASTASAIEPIPRNGQPKFKFSLAAYSYRDLLKADSVKLTLTDFIDDCAKFGLEGTELTSYYFPKNTTPEYLRTLRRQCFRLGLDVSGTAVGNDFGHPPGEKRSTEIANVKTWIEFAEILGAPVIRIFAGHQQKDQTEAQAHSLMVQAMEECCDYAGKHGVHLALENHGGPTDTADGILKFVRDVQSPWFGVNLDSGNFHSDDPYAELERIAPYALNAQIKVVMSGTDKKKVPADFKRLAKILAAAHYRGYIVLEYEESGNPREECEKYIDQIREAFA